MILMPRTLLLTGVLVNAERGILHWTRFGRTIAPVPMGRSIQMVARILIGAALLSLAAPALAEDWDFVLVNKTGKTIKTIELSEAGKGEWKPESLAEDMVHDPVRPGTSHTVKFDKVACSVDVRLTFDDDSQTVFTKFNACDNAFGDFAFKGDLPVVKGS
jgi:hypothetical protein